MSNLSRFKWALPILGLLVSQMASADATDTRKKLGETSWPSRTIGEVIREGQEPCTGTLVGYHLVLTAASCVYVNENTARRGQIRHNLKGFRVRGGYKPKSWINPVVAVWSGTTFSLLESGIEIPVEKGVEIPEAPIDTERNWAILVLAEYTGHGALLPENINPPDPEFNWKFTGYGYEKPRTKPLPGELYSALYDECIVSQRDGDWPVMMKSQCRMSPSGIGGPDILMMKRPGVEELDPVIVGMHILIKRPDGVNTWGSPYQPYNVENSYVLSIKAVVFEDPARTLLMMEQNEKNPWPDVIEDTAILCRDFPQGNCPLHLLVPPRSAQQVSTVKTPPKS